MSSALHGRRALVTGAATGIGRGTAQELAARGAAVAVGHLPGKQDAEAATLCDELRAAGATAVPVALDVTDEDAVRDAFAAAAGAFGGPVDLAVNNAGVEAPFELVDLELDEWRRVLDVNLTGTFLCTREAARGLRAADAPGTIVQVSSVHEVIPWPSFSHYCASKGAIKLFMQTVARELAPHGIRVNSVAPGAIATPINRDVLADPEAKQAVLDQIPLGRWGDVGDVARAIAWLASDEAAYVTGTTLVVDGGMLLYPEFELSVPGR